MWSFYDLWFTTSRILCSIARWRTTSHDLSRWWQEVFPGFHFRTTTSITSDCLHGPQIEWVTFLCVCQFARLSASVLFLFTFPNYFYFLMILSDYTAQLGCNGDLNATLKQCPIPCPSTCDEPNASRGCLAVCIQDACVCNPGYVWTKFGDGGKCIKREDCPSKTLLKDTGDRSSQNYLNITTILSEM